MQREKQEGWTWIPAGTRRQFGGGAIGGLVLAIACLSIGIVIGRVSISPQDHSAEHGSATVQVPNPTGPEASPELSGWPEPGPSAAEAEVPTLALGSKPWHKGQAGSDAPPSHTLRLLNPEIARAPSAIEEDERPTPRKRALAKKNPSSRSSRSVGRRATSSSRDYQALRAYMLGK
jgi:hypothetical protein